MESKELRIFNFVEYDGCTRYVKNINSKFVHLHDACDYAINEIKPIPITEEWLLKFGFEKNLDGCPTLKKDHQYFQYWEGRLTWQQSPHNDWSEFKIQFVHQLQNLYFALTGEELTAK